MIAFFAIVFGIIYLDQLTKWLAIIFLKGNESAIFINGILKFTYIENEGAAFGMLANHRWVFLVISTIAIIGIIIYMMKWRPKSKLAFVAISFIVGGGIGNMIDRIWLGYVVDFIDFCAFPTVWKYIFNVADSFVCVGAGLLMLYMVLTTIEEYKAEKLKKSTTDEEEKTDDRE